MSNNRTNNNNETNTDNTMDHLLTNVVEQALGAVDPRYIHLFNTTVNILDNQNLNSTFSETQNNTTNQHTIASRRLSRFVLNSLNSNTNQTTNDFLDVPVTLSENLLDKINVKYINKCNCCICLDDITNEYGKELPCSHTFHTHCIDNWLLNEKVTCPMCRIDIRDHMN